MGIARNDRQRFSFTLRHTIIHSIHLPWTPGGLEIDDYDALARRQSCKTGDWKKVS